MPPALIRALLLVDCVPSPAACGDVAPVVANPTGVTVPGVKAGPLLFAIGGWREEEDARIGWARRADLIKVIIQPIEHVDRPLVVEGRRCDDGSALRFAEGPVWVAGPDRTPPPDDVIDRLTSVRREIAPPFGLADLSRALLSLLTAATSSSALRAGGRSKSVIGSESSARSC